MSIRCLLSLSLHARWTLDNTPVDDVSDSTLDIEYRAAQLVNGEIPAFDPKPQTLKQTPLDKHLAMLLTRALMCALLSLAVFRLHGCTERAYILYDKTVTAICKSCNLRSSLSAELEILACVSVLWQTRVTDVCIDKAMSAVSALPRRPLQCLQGKRWFERRECAQ